VLIPASLPAPRTAEPPSGRLLADGPVPGKVRLSVRKYDTSGAVLALNDELTPARAAAPLLSHLVSLHLYVRRQNSWIKGTTISAASS
jgi:hypothetical protein